MLDTLDGLVYLVGQLALLLAAAAVLGLLLGRYVWAGRTVRALTREVADLRRPLAGPSDGAPGFVDLEHRLVGPQDLPGRRR